MTLPTDDGSIEALGLTPELTEAIRYLSDINTLDVLLGKYADEYPLRTLDEVFKLRARLDEYRKWQVAKVNELLEREDRLRRG